MALQLSYDDIQSEVATYIGWGRLHTAWSAAQIIELDDIIQSGLRQFYYPPPVEGNPVYRWSFLSPVTTVALSANPTVLPANFAGNLRDCSVLSYPSVPLVEVTMQRMQVLQATAITGTGDLYGGYFAVSPIASISTAAQTWGIWVAPTNLQTGSINCRYDIQPLLLNGAYSPSPGAVMYHLGGPLHSETVLASCLAVAEERKNDSAQIMRPRFFALLAASVQLDQKMTGKPQTDTWPLVTVPTVMDVTYPDLMRHVGHFLGYGWDVANMNRDQSALCDDIVNMGLRQFYRPVATIDPDAENKEGHAPLPHRWSFLEFIGSLSTVASTNAYTMPADFNGELLGDITYAAGVAQTHIHPINNDRMRDLIADTPVGTTGPPQYVSIQPVTNSGTARQTWQAMFYPTPDQVYVLGFQYVTIPVRLTASAPYPLGSVDHAETILASCLAVAEERMKPEGQTLRERYKVRLTASLQIDSRAKPSEESWPLGMASQNTLDVDYTQLLMRVGKELGFGWVTTAWSTEQRRRVDLAIQSGLRQFYFPAPLGKERVSHEWSFLTPLASMTTIAPYSQGTVNIVNGVVYILGGFFPAWATTGYFTCGGASMVPVVSRQSGAQITLSDLTQNAASGSTFTLTPSSTYALPLDFAALDGPMTFAPGQSVMYRPIEIIAEHEVRSRLAQLTYSFRPTVAAIIPNAINQAAPTSYSIVFYPIADQAYTLNYRYRVNVNTLDGFANSYPPGTMVHAETYLYSCLAAAERMRDGKEGPHGTRFRELLVTSIMQDRQASAPAFLGYNRDNSDYPSNSYPGGFTPYWLPAAPTSYNGVSY